MTTPTPKRGRPFGSTTLRTARLPEVRCTPEQRETFHQLGGADWIRPILDRETKRRAKESA